MINQTLLKIAEFTELPEGWHFGEGKKINSDIKSIAEKIFYKIFSQGIVITDAFPGIDGEIRITGYFDDNYLEFTLEADKTITYLYEINDIEIEYKERLSIVEALKIIQTITNKINPNKCLFDQYIRDIGIKKDSDFKAWHSGHPVRIMGSLPSVNHVEKRNPSHYVNMPKHFTETSPMNLLSFGSSTQGCYQKDVQLIRHQALAETYVIAT